MAGRVLSQIGAFRIFAKIVGFEGFQWLCTMSKDFNSVSFSPKTLDLVEQILRKPTNFAALVGRVEAKTYLLK